MAAQCPTPHLGILLALEILDFDMLIRFLLSFSIAFCSIATEQSVAGGEAFQQRIDELIKQDSLDAFIYTYLDEFLKDPTYERLYLFEEADEKQWRDPKNKQEYLASTIFLCNKGYYLLQYSLVDEAVRAYEIAWSYDQRFAIDGFDIIEYCLKPLGNAYSILGDYASAESIIKSYLLEAQKKGLRDQQVSALINLSIVYHDTGKNKEAIEVLSTARNSSPGKAGLVYSNLAKNYLNINELTEARAYALKAAQAFEKMEAVEDLGYLTNVYSILSSISLMKGDSAEALNYLGKARHLMEAHPLVKSREYAKVIVLEAGILSAMGDYGGSLNNYNQALQQLIPQFKPYKWFPSEEMLYAENTFKEIFDGMANVFVSLDSPDQAITCYKKSFSVEERLKQNYGYNESKYLQQGENRWRAEQMLALFYRLFVLTKDIRYIREAFEVAEMTKSIALKDKLYNRMAWESFAGDPLFVKRKKLALRRSRAEAALVQEQLKGKQADMGTIEYLMDRKNKAAMDLKVLERKMPGLAIKNNGQTNLDSLQHKVRLNQLTLVEYFFGTEALYAFVFDGSSVKMYRNNDIEQVREAVIQYGAQFTDEVKINAAPDIFAGLSQRLFGILLPFSVDHGLLIIPDGLLNFIPFEALLTGKPTSADFSQWPWLIYKSPVFYQYSAALYLNDFQRGELSADKVLGFFPRFADTDRYLKYSQNELDEIRKYFDGDFLSNNEATKQAFISRAPDYPVIHLSTHAKPGGFHEPPSVAFADSALYLPEVFGLDLNTRLLVLGACETGIGKLYKGEGPLSLATGFLHAGVNNIVLSLWKVNDYSTSRLMANFYRNYNEEPLAYDALHQAKLDYLKDRNVGVDKKSPYYWAPFVYYGGHDSDGINQELGFSLYMLFVVVAVVGVGVWSYYRKLK
ncbi:CHAT domain-containing protein [Fulvivirga sp. 29W222]|uniref:CHAT domain-containing protein n=1 Tax=Fulvivirga marina TaxID=2494733 RepID=A0A937G224_9BACT|nr:CHAT domain-containing protein [Fulvivirga marina]MBL6447041.1 CHAT domain-containing protein [Fulvivirga marina]